jgi:predicted RNA binding protein YcfA (HicA-like mRNA interferase family)
MPAGTSPFKPRLVISFLRGCGFQAAQGKGDHLVLRNPADSRRVGVPNGGKWGNGTPQVVMRNMARVLDVDLKELRVALRAGRPITTKRGERRG